jgi:ketosteroid isomerase-like protein
MKSHSAESGDDHSTDALTEVSIALRRLSESWRNRRYDELLDCFHDSAVMALPGLSERIVGRDALVESYREFMDRSTLDSYSEALATIETFENTAVAHFQWEMVWTSGGKQDRSSGRDLFVFAREPESGRWKAVWRTMLIDQGS